MNVELLEKVKQHILEEPKRFFMEDFILEAPAGSAVKLDDVTRTMPSCGTAACIAGWAVILSHGGALPSGTRLGCFTEACNLLGFKLDKFQDSEEADRLFVTSDWPSLYRQAYLNAKTVEDKAQIAANRIDHFIKTKGAE